MSVISIVIMLLFFGFFSWLVTQIPMPNNVKNIIIGVLIFVLVLALIQAFGFYNFGLKLM